MSDFWLMKLAEFQQREISEWKKLQIDNLARAIKAEIAATSPSVCVYSSFRIDDEGNTDDLIIGYDGEFDLRKLAEALLGGLVDMEFILWRFYRWGNETSWMKVIKCKTLREAQGYRQTLRQNGNEATAIERISK